MPNELSHLDGEEISAVTRAANRRQFLVRKEASHMDDTKAIALLNELDEAGMTEVLADLAKASDGEADGEEDGMDENERKRYKAAKRVLGPKLARKFMKAMGDEEEEEEAEAPKLKRRKGESMEDYEKRCKARKKKGSKNEAFALPEEGAEGFAGHKFRKSADGSYDLTGVPEDMQPAILAVLTKADEDRERVEKAETRLAEMLEKSEQEVFIRKAQGYSHLPGMNADSMANILRKTSKAVKPEEFAAFEKMLGAVNTLLSKSAAFGEIGSAVTGEETGDPEAELTAKAEELRKSEKGLTLQMARARIIKSDAGLSHRIVEAHDRRIAAAKRGS